ncbi:hypothetical protein OH76DRAFT_1488180 [Lentinus brumalis]|uniref:DUF6534 domain-containing protein n=1 Tax=Lentinus brumalis TaxID=2498619 RepID=A0A371CS14_9APHY|nr:hypothetical protein OH76DRAFT_1488180 [Polyporus brumalis]
MATSDVADVLGAMLVEICLACMLFGATTIQSFVYFQTDASAGSSRSLKSVVGSIWFLEALHTACSIQFAYAYTIKNFGNYDFMNRISWGAATTILIGAIISLLVHGFYIKRIYTLGNGSVIIPVVLAIPTLGNFACGIGSFALMFGHREWTAFRVDLPPMVTMTVGLGCAAAADFIIMLTTAYYIRLQRHKGNHPPGNWADTILTYSVNTGALTTIISILSVVLFVTEKHSLVYLGFIQIQTKLYSNSMLGTLNISAITPEATQGGVHPNTYKLNPRPSGVPQFGPRTARTDMPPPQVTIMQETVVSRDDLDYDDSDFKSSIGLAITADSPQENKKELM